ncbi:hypothetical protein DL240_14150 [Lujinxingia litoralis]|uniref:Nucleotidyltransferase family protein n=1 Tax=Lujinxingia litoralis TaxID=2211119 RepID=A0A328C4F0_9DELT|nr:nucleotidyltransferase family protein [Lujinxingia litoralis]RAL21264.1 hypothetical protein DL240_14150 [Lujinxingia litoralis]
MTRGQGWYEGALRAMAGGVALEKLDERGAEGVLSRARRFGLEAPVCAVLPAVGAVSRERLRLAAQAALVRETTLEVVEALKGLSFLILKGAPLAALLFGEDARCRVSADVDVLVLPGDREEVSRRLRQRGYAPAREEAPREWAYNQHAWCHRRTGVMVEVHWAVGFPELPHLSVGRCLQQARRRRLWGQEVPVPAESWAGLQLAMHLQQHLGFARGLLDLGAYLDRYPQVWAAGELENLARTAGLWGVVCWGIRALELLVERHSLAPVPRGVGAVEVLARVSAAAARGALVGEAPGRLRGAVAAVMPEVGPAAALMMRAATMAALDTPKLRARGMVHATLLGPHELGRGLDRLGAWRWVGPG